MELVLFVGLQGAGKSSFFRDRFARTHVHVSKDLWPNARNREARQRREIEEALASGRDVVVDNTNPSADQRAPLIAIGRAHGVRIVACWFDVDVEHALRRNSMRTGRARVPDVAIFATKKKLEPPRQEEGFDEIYRVRFAEEGVTVEAVGGRDAMHRLDG